MDRNLQFTWIEEILSKCNMCKVAIAHMRWYEKNRSGFEGQEINTDWGFEAISSFFYQAAGISHILWPQARNLKKTSKLFAAEERKRLRGEHLRALLSVNETHLLSNRGMRNHFAHMDERIDSWGAHSSHRNYAGKLWDDLTISGDFNASDQFEQYLPSRDMVIFQGETYSIKDFSTAVEEIYERAAPHSYYQYQQRRMRELEERESWREQPE